MRSTILGKNLCIMQITNYYLLKFTNILNVNNQSSAFKTNLDFSINLREPLALESC